MKIKLSLRVIALSLHKKLTRIIFYWRIKSCLVNLTSYHRRFGLKAMEREEMHFCCCWCFGMTLAAFIGHFYALKTTISPFIFGLLLFQNVTMVSNIV